MVSNLGEQPALLGDEQIASATEEQTSPSEAAGA